MGEDIAFRRATYFDDEHPNPPYPNGFYLEGWDKMPAEIPPFDFPLAYA